MLVVGDLRLNENIPVENDKTKKVTVRPAKKAWVLSYPLSTQRNFDQTGRLSLCWAHSHLLVLSCRSSSGS